MGFGVKVDVYRIKRVDMLVAEARGRMQQEIQQKILPTFRYITKSDIHKVGHICTRPILGTCSAKAQVSRLQTQFGFALDSFNNRNETDVVANG